MDDKDIQIEKLTEEEKARLIKREASSTIDNNSYFDLQHCVEGAANLDYKMMLGVYLTGEKCPDRILWYEDGKNFTEVLDDRDGSMEIETNDIDSSTRVLKDLTLGQITHERKMSIKVEPRSELYNKFREISIRDTAEGHEGKLIKKYMNHGFHMRLIMVDSNAGYKVERIDLNMVLTNWIDTEWLNPNVEDAAYELNFRLRYWGNWVITGDFKENSLPDKNMEMQFDTTSVTMEMTANELKISGIKIKDEFGLTDDEVFRVYVKDDEGNLIGQTENSVLTGEDAIIKGVFEDGKKYYINLGYVYGDKVGVNSAGLIHVSEVLVYIGKIDTPARTKAIKKEEK